MLTKKGPLIYPIKCYRFLALCFCHMYLLRVLIGSFGNLSLLSLAGVTPLVPVQDTCEKRFKKKNKPTVTCIHAFSHAWLQLLAFASSSALFASVMVGQSGNFDIGSATQNKIALYNDKVVVVVAAAAADSVVFV